MATHARGNMAFASQAITAKNHNISIPPGAARTIGKALLRQSHIEETDAGRIQKQARDLGTASGIPLMVYKQMMMKSANELTANNVTDEVLSFLEAKGTLAQRFNVNLIPQSKKDKSFLHLMQEIDKYGENLNIRGLSTMSKKKITSIRDRYNANDPMRKFLDDVIKLKDHQHKLGRFSMEKSHSLRSIIKLARKHTQEVDSLNVSFTIYDTVESVRSTIKTVKKIKKLINRSSGNAARARATQSAGAGAFKNAARGARAARNAATATTATATTATATTATATTATATTATATTATATTATATTATATTATATTATATTATATTTTATAAAGSNPIVLIIAAVVVVVIFIFSVLLGIVTVSNNTIIGFGESGNDSIQIPESYESISGKLYSTLREKDAIFIDQVNNYGDNNSPSDVKGEWASGYYDYEERKWHHLKDWDNVIIKWQNGSGELLHSTSNAKGILSAATVFIDQDYVNLKNTYREYSLKLWEDSHNIEATMSDVYPCEPGCSIQTYYCNDVTIYRVRPGLHIIDGFIVDYSETGCNYCASSRCSGCETIYCGGYHDGVSCAGHSVCAGHIYEPSGSACSNSYYTEISRVYTCSGCVPEINDNASLPGDGTESVTYYCPQNGIHIVSVSEPSCNGHCYGHELTLCLGHVDLTVTATVNHIDDEENNLFDVDTTGEHTGETLCFVVVPAPEFYSWDGWNEDLKELAIQLATDDWYELYGIGASDSDNYFYTAVSEEVLQYEQLITKYANQHGISEYVELIKAVMMQESGGRGSDPMQASECGYNTKYPTTPNGITDPEYSINVGIRYLADCISQAQAEGPSDIEKVKLALQGYNFGTGYISWALKNYGGYSLENAAIFSDDQAKALGWMSYGDKQYVPHVMRYYISSKGNQSIVEVALSQVGNVGGRPYWSWYGYNGHVAWCACFVSWCADQCGYIDDGTILKFAYCPTGANWFKERNQWRSRNYEPVAGDIIFFDWEGDGTSDHVGIVTKTENGTVYTVEGNSGDECKKKQYAVGSSCIYGYGIPSYPND